MSISATGRHSGRRGLEENEENLEESSSEYATRPCIKHAAFSHNVLSVYEDVVDAFRVPTWLIIGGGVNDLFRIKHDDVRFHARPDEAAIAKAETVRRSRCHLSYRIRQIESAEFSAVVAQNSRKSAV